MTDTSNKKPAMPESKLPLPENGKLYHGVFTSRSFLDQAPELPCDANWFRPEYLTAYLDRAFQNASFEKKSVAWCLVDNHWYRPGCREFPTSICNWVWNYHGDGRPVVPYVYLYTTSHDRTFEPDPEFNLIDIIEKKRDCFFKKWAKGAAEFEHPIMVSWGSECNGYWRSWNGMYNGIDQERSPGVYEGPARYVEAYQHIVELMKSEGATNINWIFEVVGHDNPNTAPREGEQGHKNWNAFENYYPGDDYVDWVGVSLYAAQFGEEYTDDVLEEDFKNQFLAFYKRWQQMKCDGLVASDKPFFVGEFGCCAITKGGQDPYLDRQAATWAKAALDFVFNEKAAGNYPHLIGFNWWNEAWDNGVGEPMTEMRIQNIKALGEVFEKALSDHESKVQGWMNVGT